MLDVLLITLLVVLGVAAVGLMAASALLERRR